MIVRKLCALLCAALFALLALAACAHALPLPETDGAFYGGMQPHYYEHWVRNGDMRIYGRMYVPDDFDPEGEYPLVVLAHGFTATVRVWSPYALLFTRMGIACYAFDFCGGSLDSRSDGSMTQMSVATECSDLTAVLDDMQRGQDIVHISSLYLMGESFGGLVSASVAPSVSEEIGGLILLYPAFNAEDEAEADYGGGAPIPQYPQFLGTTVGQRFVEDLLGYDTYARIAAYTGKVLIFHGDRDGIVPLSYSERAAEVCEDAELTVYPEGVHGLRPSLAADICGKVAETFSIGTPT